MGSEIVKRPTGRPMKFKSADEVLKKGFAYFRQCEEKKEPLTITGLAMALDTTRETLCDYGEKDGFSDAIKRLKLVVEDYLVRRTLTAPNPAGPIFLLKASFGYRDTVDIKFDGTLKPGQYTPDEEAELREFARQRAIMETAKAITAGDGE
jgi:hypothetical protein